MATAPRIGPTRISMPPNRDIMMVNMFRIGSKAKSASI